MANENDIQKRASEKTAQAAGVQTEDTEETQEG